MALVKEGARQKRALKLVKFDSVAALPTASLANAGSLGYISGGVTGGGPGALLGSPGAAGMLVFCDGVNWVDAVTNTTVV